MLVQWGVNNLGVFELFAILIGLLSFYSLLILASIYHQNYKNFQDLTDYLDEFKDCIYLRVEHENIFSESTLQIIRERGNNREIFVYKVNQGNSSVMPSGLKVFASFANEPTRIFIKDKPQELNFLQKFMIYHELGHSDWDSSSVYMEKNLLKNNLFSLIFFFIFYVSLFFMPFNSYNITSIVMLFTPLIFVLFFNNYLLSSNVFKLMDEINADQFAIIRYAMDYPNDFNKATELYSQKILQTQRHPDGEKELRLNVFNKLVKKIKNNTRVVAQKNDILLPMIITLTCLFVSGSFLPAVEPIVLYSMIFFFLFTSAVISISKRQIFLNYRMEHYSKNDRLLSNKIYNEPNNEL